MEHNPIRKDARKIRRQRRVGNGAACSVCSERDPNALIPRADRVVCYECLAMEGGRTPTEPHHLGGSQNSPFAVTVPGNDHRVLSDYQQDWPQETLRNPDGSPLLKAAALIRGWLDILRLIIERAIGWIPPFLERLDAWLQQQFGPCWWHRMAEMQP